MNVGRAIKMCRGQRGMNQRELAKKSELSLSYVSMIESNKRDPGLASLQSIALALRIPLSLIVFLAADKEDLKGMDETVREKLSAAVLELMYE